MNSEIINNEINDNNVITDNVDVDINNNNDKVTDDNITISIDMSNTSFTLSYKHIFVLNISVIYSNILSDWASPNSYNLKLFCFRYWYKTIELSILSSLNILFPLLVNNIETQFNKQQLPYNLP